MPDQYLSTDPNAGDEYLSLDPNAGEETPAKPEKSLRGFGANLVRNVPEAIVNSLKAMVTMNDAARNPLFAGQLAEGMAKSVGGAVSGTVNSLREKGLGQTAKDIGQRGLDYAYDRPVEAAMDALSVVPVAGPALRATRVPGLVRAGNAISRLDAGNIAARMAPDPAKIAKRAENMYIRGLKTPVEILKRNKNTLGGDVATAERTLARRAIDEGVVLGPQGGGKELLAKVIDAREDEIGNIIGGSTKTATAKDVLQGGQLESLLKQRAELTASDPGHRRLNATKEVARTFVTDPMFSKPAHQVPGLVSSGTQVVQPRGRVLNQVPIQKLQALKRDINRTQISPQEWAAVQQSGTAEGLMAERADLARAIRRLEPGVETQNAALKELYPLQEAVQRVDPRMMHHDPLGVRAGMGSWIFGGPTSGLGRRLVGAAVGAKINSPTTISQAAIAMDTFGKQAPAMFGGASQLLRANQAAAIADDPIRDALMEAMNEAKARSTETP